MDDLELEGRLRTHLHRRLDDAPLPNELATNVGQALATAARPVGLATRTGRIRLGWAVLAAVLVIALGAIGLAKRPGPSGPAASSTPSPHAPASQERDFIVLPPTGASLDKASASLAMDILSARIGALGIGNFGGGGGYGITVTFASTEPSDASVRAVLGATGDMQVVPLPAADYGAGKLTATIGAPLPKAEPALFGWEGIASIATDTSGTPPGILVTLKPAAAQAFGDYTAAHVGDTFAIVLDGRVAMVTMTTEAITSGQIEITGGTVDPGWWPFTEAAAILVGGELPEAWRGASVPVIVSRDQAIAAALAATHGGSVQLASPSADLGPVPGSVQAVWYVDVYQPDCPDTASCISMYLRVRVDAVTGLVLDMAPQGSSTAP